MIIKATVFIIIKILSFPAPRLVVENHLADRQLTDTKCSIKYLASVDIAVSAIHCVDQMSIVQMSVGQMSIGQMSIDQISVGKMSVCKMSVGQLSHYDECHYAECRNTKCRHTPGPH